MASNTQQRLNSTTNGEPVISGGAGTISFKPKLNIPADPNAALSDVVLPPAQNKFLGKQELSPSEALALIQDDSNEISRSAYTDQDQVFLPQQEPSHFDENGIYHDEAGNGPLDPSTDIFKRVNAVYSEKIKPRMINQNQIEQNPNKNLFDMISQKYNTLQK